MKDRYIDNIGVQEYKKIYLINGKECTITIKDALCADYKGNREVLDKQVLDSMCKAVSKAVSENISKYNEIPNSISISHNEMNDDTKINKSELAVIREPLTRLQDIALTKETLEQIEIIFSAIQNKEKLATDWGLQGNGMENRALVLNFYGYPGTGKTLTAEGIANYLDKKLLQVNYSELESKYVGDTPKNIKMVFQEAREKDVILVFDEADSFLSMRLTNVTQAADYGVNIARSTMLLELEKFEGIVIFTTNLFGNYDQAFKRRIFANIEFKKPDTPAREKIWRYHIGSKMPIEQGITVKMLADQYENITGADIKDIVFYAALSALQKNQDFVQLRDFDIAYEYVMKRYEQEE